ncbi:bifunctional lysylphosphatidylglycerol flippase/synthetase MprF [Caulobacter sp. FWC2]|uniref:phosphatidylglycerol lysyltransferase domain-containing protein n=1 Tax=Caulobacter sp. FWC2 TaxID=69664 RepID=UPI000C160172|nr:bifunctional lysylphosphatidylglycerol flippase/synthetase MprF [Caulobacter sp. FWC2]PIB93099.1 oxacillin resistance protein FmtC [Caulobacter sp. FWC2]
MSSTVFRPAALAIAPTLAAILTASAGVMLLASGATPSEPTRFLLLLAFAPDLLIEISHFFSSILGLVLLLLAFGLRARLGAAWWAALVVLAASAVLAIFKGLNWEETAMLSVCFLSIVPFHDAFPRKAALTRMEVTPGWLLSAGAVVGGVALLGWWSFNHTEYVDKSFLRVLQDDELRAIRSSVAAAIVLLAVGVWRLIATAATPSVVDDTDPEFDRVRAILAKAQDAEPSANLALLGDKRFLFSASGESFLMFGVRGRSWIALGAPIGKEEERMELFWRFRELADAHAARAGFYGLGPDDLPDSVDLGLAIQKTGESAAVPLEAFSLAGRRREVLRRNWRKAGEGGAAFEVLPAGAAVAIMDELKAISDAWLSHHAGGEKSFSMGGFDPRYVAEFPVAVVRGEEGKIVAFATLWLTACKTAFSMDLMRYSDEAPKNVMDYLFVELLQWGKDEGYQAFEFGMAPLAGLEDRPLAPIMSRVGRLLYERGEEIYNFQGVRRYKDKYDPVWQPRYIAAPHKWAIPFLLADIGLLSSGGMSGLTKRPKKTPARPAT